MEEQASKQSPNMAEKKELNEEIQKLRQLIFEYGPKILWVVIAMIFIYGVFAFYKNRKKAMEEKAAEELFSASSYEEMEKIVKENPKSTAAPLLLLRVAKGYYNTGNYAMALSKYDEFLARYQHDLMAGTAEAGRAFCLEAMGKYDEALQKFDAFIVDHTNHYLLEHAVLGKGRCLEKLSKREEARILYENFLVSHPNTPWDFLFNEAIKNNKEQTNNISASATNVSFVIPQPILDNTRSK